MASLNNFLKIFKYKIFNWSNQLANRQLLNRLLALFVWELKSSHHETKLYKRSIMLKKFIIRLFNLNIKHVSRQNRLIQTLLKSVKLAGSQLIIVRSLYVVCQTRFSMSWTRTCWVWGVSTFKLGWIVQLGNYNYKSNFALHLNFKYYLIHLFQ